MEKTYKKALSEVDYVLNLLDENSQKQIPAKLREVITNNKIKGYKLNLNTQGYSEKLEISREARAFLTVIYEKFLCE